MRRRSGWSGSTTSAGSRAAVRSAQHRPRDRAAVPRRAAAGSSRAPRNRKDFSMPPLPGNLLRARRAGGPRRSSSIGKIGDIFAHRDTGLELKGKMQRRARRPHAAGAARDRRRRADLRQSRRFRHRIRPSPRRRRLCGLPGGVRRAAAGDPGRAARRATSASSPPTTATIRPGAATTTRASTRRSSPSATSRAGPIGARASFADIAETVAAKLGLPKGPRGTSWL